MKNPFEYGGIVSGEGFCNRVRETADLRRAVENAEKLFVFSERRFGKTSLVKRVLGSLPRDRFVPVYVDLWPTDDEAGFAAALAKALTEAVASSTNKLLATAKRLFGRLQPVLTTNDEGKPELTFRVSSGAGDLQPLEEVLNVPAHIARTRRRRVVVVLDEFQQILLYGSDLAERKLRSVIQKHGQVCYLFLGSRKHLIQGMVMDRNRPLYGAGGHYPLGPIATQDWGPFIKNRFEQAGKHIEDAEINAVCDHTQGHPFYTQHLCHALWETCEEGSTVARGLIGGAIDLLLDREAYAYATLWDTLTASQKRFVKGLADSPLGIKPFSSQFLQSYRVGSASTAQRAVKSLLEKDIIDRENGSFVISDRFFRLWILRLRQ